MPTEILVKDLPFSLSQVLRRTLVGEVVVSTVDLQRLKGGERAIVELADLAIDIMGLPRSQSKMPGQFESIVFRADDETGRVENWKECDIARCDTEEAAHAQHLAMCAKWKEKQENKPPVEFFEISLVEKP